MKVSNTSGLDSGSNEDFEQRWARAQRYVWAFGVALLLAACIGVFGGGPASHRSVKRGALEVEYERFGRMTNAQQLRVKVHGAGPETVVAFGKEALQSFDVTSIVPLPAHTDTTSAGPRYAFVSSDGEADVVFHLKPLSAGRARLDVSSGADSAQLSAFIYP